MSLSLRVCMATKRRDGAERRTRVGAHGDRCDQGASCGVVIATPDPPEVGYQPAGPHPSPAPTGSTCSVACSMAKSSYNTTQTNNNTQPNTTAKTRHKNTKATSM